MSSPSYFTQSSGAATSDLSPPSIISLAARRLNTADTFHNSGLSHADISVTLIPPNDTLIEQFLPGTNGGCYSIPVVLVKGGVGDILETVDAHERSPRTHPLRIASTSRLVYPLSSCGVMTAPMEGTACAVSVFGVFTDQLTSFGTPTVTLQEKGGSAQTVHSTASDYYADCVRTNQGRAPLMHLEFAQLQPIEDETAPSLPYMAKLDLATATGEDPQWYSHPSQLWQMADTAAARIVIDGAGFDLHQPSDGSETIRKEAIGGGLKAEGFTVAEF